MRLQLGDVISHVMSMSSITFRIVRKWKLVHFTEAPMKRRQTSTCRNKLEDYAVQEY